MKLVQVVPRLPPPEEALGHVASRLEYAFRERHGIDSKTIAAAPDRAAFVKALEGEPPDAVVLVHYVGYGYAQRGAPLWLARELATWIRAGRGRKLLVHFHEVSANGPPWRSSFWLAPLQRHVAARIASLAAGAITSLDRFASQLNRLAPSLPTTVLPIFSTVGEPATVAPALGREEKLVLFGSPAARAAVWREFLSELEATVTAFGIRRIVEIGRDAIGPSKVAGASAERCGELTASAVGDLLAGSRAGFLVYDPPFLGKSTVFAAFAAHGVVPVCEWDRGALERADGEGERWCRSGALSSLDPDRLDELGREARRWYEAHSIAAHAATWMRSLG